MTTDPKVIEMLGQEIEDLKAALKDEIANAAELAWWKDDARKLITELADALELSDAPYGSLIKRAREATRG